MTSKTLALRAPNACMPAPGVVCCGMLQPGDMESASEAGIRTIVNLCPSHETAPDHAARIDALGMTHVHIPVASVADLSEANARALAAVLDDEARLPVIVHCMSGNRVGALLALKAGLVDGRTADEAVAFGVSGGLKALEGEVRRLLSE